MARWIYTAPRSENKNGTFDSICPVCSVTISTRDREEDLVEDERKHPCIRSLLRRLSADGSASQGETQG